eukprot:CAMPEP_0194334858 /NCGR_PEP_ID=MMETSP0171-20130528/67530_1 /TAXON_ID=218684 /ORGANISM="Corethron pennatum, Strain L29A3" /LENGTH=109 /DNA_ID=CAMNT_0039097689 /DNA_START=9 /DNA_END=341 /DNA_ORIENTATION=-
MANITDNDYDPELNDKPLLTESLRQLKHSTDIGNLNDSRIQHEVVSYIADECGYDLSKYLDTDHMEYSLETILDKAQNKHVPMLKANRMIRRWFLFFVEHRTTMVDKRT